MRQTGSSTAGGITVHWPDSFSERTYYSDFKGPGAAQNLGAGVSAPAPRIDSTYDFRARDASGNGALPGIIAGRGVLHRVRRRPFDRQRLQQVHARARTSFSTHTISILGITELRGTGTTSTAPAI